MNVKINRPAPAPVPPPTFDLVGLSMEQMEFLRDTTGPTPWTKHGGEIYDKVVGAIRVAK